MQFTTTYEHGARLKRKHFYHATRPQGRMPLTEVPHMADWNFVTPQDQSVCKECTCTWCDMNRNFSPPPLLRALHTREPMRGVCKWTICKALLLLRCPLCPHWCSGSSQNHCCSSLLLHARHACGWTHEACQCIALYKYVRFCRHQQTMWPKQTMCKGLGLF